VAMLSTADSGRCLEGKILRIRSGDPPGCRERLPADAVGDITRWVARRNRHRVLVGEARVVE